MYIIGIDPSSQKGNNGFAIWDTVAKQFICVRSMGLLSIKGEALDFIESYGVKKDGKYTNVIAVVENAELDSAVFGVWQSFDSFLKSKLIPKRKGSFSGRSQPYTQWSGQLEKLFRSYLSQAQSIGKLKVACRIVLEGLEGIGLQVLQVAPSWRDSMDSTKTKKRGGLAVKDVRYMRMPTKTTAEDFKVLTNYSERSNEHGRDAATLIFNQTKQRLDNWIMQKMVTSKGIPTKLRIQYLESRGIKI